MYVQWETLKGKLESVLKTCNELGSSGKQSEFVYANYEKEVIESILRYMGKLERGEV